MRGFWISKYELSKNNDSYKSISGSESYRNDTLDNYKSIIDNITSNYKLGDNVSSHVVSNLEWGATLYLSHSKYGLCDGDGCKSISVNNSYIAGSNKQDTTTRNVYGVYDMAGGSKEYAIGDCTIGTATDEVRLDNGNWYNGHGICGIAGYILRGGKDNGMFTYGELSMDYVENGTRMCLVSK